MKIALVGYGAMGRLLEETLTGLGHELGATIDPKVADASFSSLGESPVGECDVAIDFSHPTGIMENIKFYTENGINVVVGTTGWYGHVEQVEKDVLASGNRFLWGSNFSLGVNAYFKIVEYAATVANRLEEFDVWANEVHHNNKADSPSGTAETLTDIILSKIDRKSKAVYDKLDRRIEPDEFHFGSVRGGPVNFEHTISFDSGTDLISLRHSARNRSGYAEGAVAAAEWLAKQKPGYYQLDDFISGILK